MVSPRKPWLTRVTFKELAFSWTLLSLGLTCFSILADQWVQIPSWHWPLLEVASRTVAILNLVALFSGFAARNWNRPVSEWT